MQTPIRATAQLGELIATVYDIAAQYSLEPKVISRLAARVVQQMISRADRTMAARRRAGIGAGT